MALTRSKAEHETAIQNALTRLGIARRERLKDEDYDVYADGLRTFPAAAVVAVCEEFARREPEEFGPRFPTLGSLREGVQGWIKREQLRREMNQRRLPEGRPVDPPKLEDFKRRVAAHVATRKMP